MTPERLREIAASEDEEGEEAFRAGDVAQAEVLWRRAEVRRELARRLERGERLPSAAEPGNNLRMTSAQRRRRGEAISRARSYGPIAQAITASRDPRTGRQRTITSYARELRIAQPTLSRYLSGSLPVPPEVAERVRADLGVSPESWPKPPRRI